MYERLCIILFKQAYQGSNCQDYMGHIANTTFGFKHYEELLETLMGLKHLLNGRLLWTR
jgi:hypothetical protein